MSSKRKAIREAVVAALLEEDATSAGERVFDSRVVNYFDLEMPAIAVYTREEFGEPQNIGQTPTNRTLQVVIECVVAGSGDSVEGDLDDLIDEVETIMSSADSFGEAYQWYLTSVDTDASADGERILAAAAMTYEMRYIA